MRTYRVKTVVPLLHVLRSVRPDHRVILLYHLDNESRDAVCEAVSRVLLSPKVPLKKRLFLKSKLKPYKTDLRYLADRTRPSSGRRRRLTQLGAGPLRHVLLTAVPLLMNLFPPALSAVERRRRRRRGGRKEVSLPSSSANGHL